MSDKVPHEESFYIEAMLKNDPFVTKRIYDEFYPKIRRMVTINSGNTDDAWDVFQEAIIVIYKRALDPNFVLTSPFYFFFYKVCWHIWMKELKSRGLFPKVTIENEDGYIDETNIEEVIRQMERYALYEEKFALLGEQCQKLIKLALQKTKMREIAVLLNYKNEHTTRQQHFKCKKRLTNSIQEDPRYKDLKD